ncbi:hypothetical protein GcM1_198019, partial [Golovinomyces cichoracearum]
MSIMNFYQASPNFSRTSQKLSTRVNEKRVKEKHLAKPVWNLESEEEELLVEAFSSLVATARKNLALRNFGEVLATRDGKTGKFYLDESMVCADQGSDMVLISPQLVLVLQLKNYSLDVINTHAITIGTVDGTSDRITEWVSFVFITGGVQRQICAFVRPERCPTLDAFLPLGLPLLHSVKEAIDIYRSQIRIGDKSLGKICTIFQEPTLKFTKAHRLHSQLTQIPFKNALRTVPFERKEKALESNDKESMTRTNFEKLGKILGKNLNSKESTITTFDKQSNKRFDDISFSSETEDSITINGSDNEEDQAINDFNSASTDPN